MAQTACFPFGYSILLLHNKLNAYAVCCFNLFCFSFKIFYIDTPQGNFEALAKDLYRLYASVPPFLLKVYQLKI